MKIEVFALCDAATEWMGKLNILGTFDTVYTSKVPAVHAVCAIAGRVRMERIEEGEHELRINVIDADGTAVVPALSAKMNAKLPPGVSSHAFNFIINMQQLRLPSFGAYAIDLAIDGRQEGSVPLFLRQRPAQ